MSRKRNTARNALSLVELLISMTVTAFIGLAVAMILQSAAYGTSSKRDARRIATRAETSRGRINDAIRGAGAFLAVGSNYLVLWRGDTNKNDGVNLSELQMIELTAATGTLTSYTAKLPVGTDTAYASTVDFYSTLQSAKSGGLLTAVVWATGVSSFTTILDNGTPQQAVLATWTMTLANGGLSEPLLGAACLRYPVAPQ